LGLARLFIVRVFAMSLRVLFIVSLSFIVVGLVVFIGLRLSVDSTLLALRDQDIVVILSLFALTNYYNLFKSFISII
jgi:hypothetical protein